MRKKLKGKFLSMDYVPNKCQELRHTFNTFKFDDKSKCVENLNEESKFDEYLDDDSSSKDWCESGFEENLNQDADTELHEELVSYYSYESAFAENIGGVDDKELVLRSQYLIFFKIVS